MNPELRHALCCERSTHESEVADNTTIVHRFEICRLHTSQQLLIFIRVIHPRQQYGQERGSFSTATRIGCQGVSELDGL